VVIEELRSRPRRAGNAAANDRLRALGKDFQRLPVRSGSNGNGNGSSKSQVLPMLRPGKWSDTADQTLGIAENISREPAQDVVGLAIKFEAICWWIVEDDSLLDEPARRWLLRFRRSLHHRQAKPGTCSAQTSKARTGRRQVCGAKPRCRRPALAEALIRPCSPGLRLGSAPNGYGDCFPP
jgi:hypothetical protein